MTAVAHQRLTLRGMLVSHKVFSADGWGKGQLEVPGKDPFVTEITGKLLNVRVGDSVEVIGNYVETKYGTQFKVDSCTPRIPDSVDGIVLWMVSRFPDVGVTRAHSMIARFTDQLWTVIEREPQRLTEIKGITAERADAISAAYKSCAHEREHMTKLRGWGLTDKQVARCIEAWGDLAIVIERIRADPYELANVVDGFGFKRADRVAMAMGIKPDAPSRIRAGILYTLDAGAAEGHCFLWGGMLRDMASRLLGVEMQLVVKEIFAVCEMQRVVRRGARVYSMRYDRAEAACAVVLERMLERVAA